MTYWPQAFAYAARDLTPWEFLQVLAYVARMMELRDWLHVAYAVASVGVFTTMAWRRHGQ